MRESQRDSYRLNWAALGHLERCPNIYTACHQIGDTFTAASEVIEDVTPLTSHVR